MSSSPTTWLAWLRRLFQSIKAHFAENRNTVTDLNSFPGRNTVVGKFDLFGESG